jgi:rare lipoprotein A
LNSIIRVTNLTTGQSAIVRVNDRGPFVRGRVLDLSIAAARATGVYRVGSAKVRIDVLQWPPNAAKSGHWCVQIGAFQSEGNAVALKRQLLERYTSSTVIEFPGDTGYWVRMKPYDLAREHAIEVASSIRTSEQSVEAFLVRLD